jgi:hypothetical protein
MKKETNLFQEVKKYINNVAIGKEFTTKDLIENVGEFELLTGWKWRNGNPFYRTHSYKGMLRATGFVTNVKRGVWVVNKHIPDFVNLGTIEFLIGYHNDFFTNPDKTYNGLTRKQTKEKIELFNKETQKETQMETFKVGDIVIFNPRENERDLNYAAEKGARALVKGYRGLELVDVKWLDEKSYGQLDGGYYEYMFIKEKKTIHEEPSTTLSESFSINPPLEFEKNIVITKFEENKKERLFQFMEKWSNLLEEYHAEVHDIEGMGTADTLIWKGIREKIALSRG